jgi:hypothetical protein
MIQIMGACIMGTAGIGGSRQVFKIHISDIRIFRAGFRLKIVLETTSTTTT